MTSLGESGLSSLTSPQLSVFSSDRLSLVQLSPLHGRTQKTQYGRCPERFAASEIWCACALLMPFCTSLSRGMEECSSKPRVICMWRIPARYAEMYLDFWSGGGVGGGGGGGAKWMLWGGEAYIAAEVTLLNIGGQQGYNRVSLPPPSMQPWVRLGLRGEVLGCQV